MWRSFFLAIGIMTLVVGAECLLIDSAALYSRSDPNQGQYLISQPMQTGTRQFVPSEWLPWSLMGAGTLTILYSITLRRAAPAAE